MNRCNGNFKLRRSLQNRTSLGPLWICRGNLNRDWSASRRGFAVETAVVEMSWTWTRKSWKIRGIGGTAECHPIAAGVIQSTGDLVGLVRTIEADDDDDWVIVELERDIFWGEIDLTCLDLAHVEQLVPYLCADLCSWEYGGGDALITASEDTRRSLLTKYLDRQLQADRILTVSNYDFGVMRADSDLAPII
ncbi:hypothetical protein THAOC_18543 [Thalassiosira oceanica]|uniref:Uncharacterized protein n=1 Tax=Thalassiosira oceanica TaxID=159749 RepID=K0S7X7_THAOC|nr:hypothetical protein THAOC_18543 [Thalassiosira oceanica]|eukprot:EJK61029.1 hypothetical protein THAOC_18543 [Thalassiosira oceanica]